MAAKPRLDQLKRQIEQLRKDSLGVVTSANRIVYDGVQKLADRELKALNDYYHSAIDSIRSANKGDLRGLAQQQLDLLQDTVNQVIAHARESMGIVAQTRAELAKLVQKGIKGEKVGAADLKKAAAPARKAVGKAQAAARKAGKSAAKSVKKSVKTTATKARGSSRKAVTEGKRSAVAVVKAVERALPKASTSSRASLATSRAKKAAGVAVEKVSDVVSSVAGAVAEAASKVSDKF